MCAAGEFVLGHLTVEAAGPLFGGSGSAGLFASGRLSLVVIHSLLNSLYF
jgi:hypothetical protein